LPEVSSGASVAPHVSGTDARFQFLLGRLWDTGFPLTSWIGANLKTLFASFVALAQFPLRSAPQ